MDAPELRVTLERQLGQHVVLATEAMRAGVTGSDDFDAADAALMANTQDLTAAIEGVYDAEAAEEFMQMWQDHIDFFVQYTVGVAEDDTGAQDEARERLEQYRQDFSAFGGTEAVPEGVADDLAAFTDGDVTRLSEPDGNRFDTAATILDAFGDADTDRVYVTTGEDFPDALATVPVAAKDQTGIALSGRDQLTQSTVDAIQNRDPSQIVIVGGTEVISEEVEGDLRAIVAGQDPPDED